MVEVKSLPRDEYMLWRELASSEKSGKRESGVLFYKGNQLDRFLAPHWLQHVEYLRAEQDRKKREDL